MGPGATLREGQRCPEDPAEKIDTTKCILCEHCAWADVANGVVECRRARRERGGAAGPAPGAKG